MALEMASLKDLGSRGLDLECNGLCIVVCDCEGAFNESSEWSWTTLDEEATSEATYC
jgi:hypothetical protein